MDWVRHCAQCSALEFASGGETISSLLDGSWIGLQIAARDGRGGCFFDVEGNKYQTTRSSDTGRWEDGTPYNKDLALWASNEPNNFEGNCRSVAEDQWFGRCYGDCDGRGEECERNGYCKRDGNPYGDPYEHCTQIFPRRSFGYGTTWNDYWCYRKNLGYVCQKHPEIEVDPFDDEH